MNAIIKSNFFHLKKTTLNWLFSRQINDLQFCMAPTSNSSNLFTSIFALFIYDIFGETKKWSTDLKERWSSHILDYQDEKNGYFIDTSIGIDTNSSSPKALFQLNTFCLSALGILKKTPKYPLHFIKQWSSIDAVRDYLDEYGCLDGVPGSGNFAMFLAIFFSYEYERTDKSKYKELLNEWFKLHNTYIKSNGMWGKSLVDSTVWGFQNALHQLVIYSYWDETPPNIDNLIKIGLESQDQNGNYGSLPGGGGCFDYDASFILLKYGSPQYSSQVVEQSHKLYYSIISNQNKDGGFCETNKYPRKICQLFKGISNYNNDRNPVSLLYRYKEMIRHLRKANQYHRNHWTNDTYRLEESDLWNTWFRLLTLAQIEKTYLENTQWNFHKSIGLGHF